MFRKNKSSQSQRLQLRHFFLTIFSRKRTQDKITHKKLNKKAI